MLKKLKIQNFAIIDNLELDLENGFNIFTGQTGAGKSLIIDSISLLLGARSDSYMIRDETDYAYVYGLFILEKTNEKIEIERFIYKNKGLVKINNEVVTLNKLKSISNSLALMSSQNDTFKLFDKNNYLSFLSSSDINYVALLDNYLKSRSNYLNALKEYNLLIKSKEESETNRAYLEFVYDDISSYKLKENELEEVQNKLLELKNYDKLFENLKDCLSLINDNAILDNIAKCNSTISKLCNIDTSYENISTTLNDVYYNLDSVVSLIKDKFLSLEFDPNLLEELNKRENDINKLMLKYKKTYDELYQYQSDLASMLDNKQDISSLIQDKENEVKILFKATLDDSRRITDYRKNIAKTFETFVLEKSMYLDLLNVKFRVLFEEIDSKNYLNSNIFKEDGMDQIDFLVSLNKGEKEEPLSIIASGGEMSRLLLIFKLFLMRNESITLVLDEIDTGVSGVASKKIARVLEETSTNNQIIMITHNPIIASQGDNHYLIKKQIKDERTFSSVVLLDTKSRIEELAIMLEGEVSDTSLLEAENLLKSKRKI